MQWTDVTRTPDTRLLRQFAALCVLLFGTAGGWRAGTGTIDEWTITLAVLTGGGALGMLWPRTVRWFAGSYWVPKPRSARLDSYLRQY